MPDPDRRPAFYATTPRHGWSDWWTLLHPPYTAWHLSYVAIGACLAPHLDALRLIASVLAFFAAVGIAAHALDELHGHPLRTRIADRALIAATAFGLLAAVALGVAGVFASARCSSRSSSSGRVSFSRTTSSSSAVDSTPTPGLHSHGAHSRC